MSSVSQNSPVEELATFLASRPSVQEIAAFRLSDSALARVEELMDRNKQGILTADEERELDRLILLDDVIGLIQSRLPAGEAGESRPSGAPYTLETPEAPGT